MRGRDYDKPNDWGNCVKKEKEEKLTRKCRGVYIGK
jgi:hypothetical protein